MGATRRARGAARRWRTGACVPAPQPRRLHCAGADAGSVRASRPPSRSPPSCRRATARPDLERIAAAAPGARLVTVSLEGLADGPLDDVEVMLRGPLPAGDLRAHPRALPRGFAGSTPRRRAWSGSSRRRRAAAGLIITNARGVFSEPIAEYVLMMMLAVIRRLPQLLELQRERTWQPLLATEMRDVTVGIVGLGSIGRAVAARALAFGSRVVAIRRQAATQPALAPTTRRSRASTASCDPTSCRSCSPRATSSCSRCRSRPTRADLFDARRSLR